MSAIVISLKSLNYFIRAKIKKPMKFTSVLQFNIVAFNNVVGYSSKFR